MFLRSLAIKNYRSLEDVRLDGFRRFNVLIGRNNSGKSSVFGALQTLNTALRGGAIDPDRVLTDLDLNRSLKITLSFELRPQDRREYIDLISAAGSQMNRRDDLLRSSFLRQITFFFETPQGQPESLHLSETKALVENNEWATIQRLDADAPRGNSQSTVVQVDALRDSSSAVTLNNVVMGVDTANETRITHTGGVDVRSEMASYAADPQPTALSATLWPYRRLVKYFSDSFYFDPFRHSTENSEAQESPELAQVGSNLAQVLFTLHNNNPVLFQRIESFVQAALPDIGTLETPLEATRTRTGFRRPSEGPFVRLHDMGGGIEQLLMTATVLMTTGNEGTLFLEEPESHLHAGAQRFLIERLYDVDRQVFVTTHSPIFVNLSRPRSFYQVTYAGGRTAVDRLGDADSLGAMLEDIGARNSDVLLSDAVLFVEGPSDRDVLYAWSKTLGMSLEEGNVTVLSMEGGDHAERKARVRSEILEGISERAPVPHLLVVDRDERSPAEIEKLQQGLGDKVYPLKRREIENYLLVPRALLEAIRLKHANDSPVFERVESASIEDVEALIEITAESLYGIVLMKRLRATLEGLKGGLLPRGVAESLAPHARRKDLARLLRGKIKSRVKDHIAGLDIDTAVRSEREQLDREWSDPGRRRQLAPGEEILVAVFNHFGSDYKKPKDTDRIAKQMRSDEIASEAKDLVTRAVSLGGRQPN